MKLRLDAATPLFSACSCFLIGDSQSSGTRWTPSINSRLLETSGCTKKAVLPPPFSFQFPDGGQVTAQLIGLKEKKGSHLVHAGSFPSGTRLPTLISCGMQGRFTF